MKADSEYPQQFTTVSEVELYARKLNEVSIRHKLDIEFLKLHVKRLEDVVALLQREAGVQGTELVEVWRCPKHGDEPCDCPIII